MSLLILVETFLAEQDAVSATALGDRVLGDRHFVRQLRAGRRCWPETAKKIEDFIASERSDRAEHRTHDSTSAIDDDLPDVTRDGGFEGSAAVHVTIDKGREARDHGA